MSASKILTHLLSEAEVPNRKPVVKLVHMILLFALESRATEVCLEPQQDECSLTCRVEGNLRELIPPPIQLAPEITQVLKVLSDWEKSSEHSGKDGRMRLVVGEGTADVVVSIHPTPHGEAVRVSFESNSTNSEEVRAVLNEYCHRPLDERPRSSWLRRLWLSVKSLGRNQIIQ